MKRILILIAALMLTGCVASEEKKEATKLPDAHADMERVNKLRSDFIAAFNANDATKIGELYAEDAVAMPGDGSPTVKGRAAIVERNKALFDAVTCKDHDHALPQFRRGDLGLRRGNIHDGSNTQGEKGVNL
jgi:ketosteroid isomerase-like protein